MYRCPGWHGAVRHGCWYTGLYITRSAQVTEQRWAVWSWMWLVVRRSLSLWDACRYESVFCVFSARLCFCLHLFTRSILRLPPKHKLLLVVTWQPTNVQNLHTSAHSEAYTGGMSGRAAHPAWIHHRLFSERIILKCGKHCVVDFVKETRFYKQLQSLLLTFYYSRNALILNFYYILLLFIFLYLVGLL